MTFWIIVVCSLLMDEVRQIFSKKFEMAYPPKNGQYKKSSDYDCCKMAASFSVISFLRIAPKKHVLSLPVKVLSTPCMFTSLAIKLWGGGVNKRRNRTLISTNYENIMSLKI